MAAPMKIKARMQGDTAEIRVLVNHPMENGQRKDAAGNLIPAHFIRRLTISLGERVVVCADFNLTPWSPSLSDFAAAASLIDLGGGWGTWPAAAPRRASSAS